MDFKKHDRVMIAPTMLQEHGYMHSNQLRRQMKKDPNTIFTVHHMCKYEITYGNQKLPCIVITPEDPSINNLFHVPKTFLSRIHSYTADQWSID